MCDTYTPQGAALPTNKCAASAQVMKKAAIQEQWLGLEQEYFMMNPANRRPLIATVKDYFNLSDKLLQEINDFFPTSPTVRTTPSAAPYQTRTSGQHTFPSEQTDSNPRRPRTFSSERPSDGGPRGANPEYPQYSEYPSRSNIFRAHGALIHELLSESHKYVHRQRFRSLERTHAFFIVLGIAVSASATFRVSSRVFTYTHSAIPAALALPSLAIVMFFACVCIFIPLETHKTFESTSTFRLREE